MRKQDLRTTQEEITEHWKELRVWYTHAELKKYDPDGLSLAVRLPIKGGVTFVEIWQSADEVYTDEIAVFIPPEIWTIMLAWLSKETLKLVKP